ncbi:hypothetical protein RB195_001032 [Necator americanus]|uniref:G-protein coupled receptors family 1 profile domain-containing protein n=1 Tax=Necator americanus TaxID=51031 RepID=A0ABR1DD34_NECAM
MAQNDEVIPFCNPPLGLAPAVSGFWSLSNIIMNSCVVLVYVVIIGFVHFKGKSNAVRGQQKVVRRLQVIVIVFILSWFMALLGVNIASLLKFPPDVRSVWQSNMVFFALVCYSQTFYVCVWRSSDYREAFMNQLRVMACRAPKTMFDSSASRSQVAHVAATQHL